MTTKTVETENAGLKRAFLLTIPAKDIDGRMEQEVKKLAPQIKMAGFRPGKVPPNLIRKMHGDRLHADALQSAVASSVAPYGGSRKMIVNGSVTRRAALVKSARIIA